MKYEIVFLGKTKNSFLALGISEYVKRLQHYTNVVIRTVKTKNIQGTDTSVVEKEGDLLLASIDPTTFLVALDSQGRQYDSMAFHDVIDKWEQSGVKHVTFVIGGPLGLSEKVLQSAALTLSLSLMTFTHDMIRLFLLEQIYRVYTIKAGEKYHK